MEIKCDRDQKNWSLSIETGESEIVLLPSLFHPPSRNKRRQSKTGVNLNPVLRLNVCLDSEIFKDLYIID